MKRLVIKIDDEQAYQDFQLLTGNKKDVQARILRHMIQDFLSKHQDVLAKLKEVQNRMENQYQVRNQIIHESRNQ